MIPLSITDGPYKGHAGHLLGYAVGANNKHWVLVILMDGTPKLAPVQVEHCEVIIPTNPIDPAEQQAATPPVSSPLVRL